MSLVTPDIGLLFWQTITFLIVLFLLSKFAWKPIMKGLKDRESKIEQALESAKSAETKMKEIESGNQKLLDEARIERDKMLKSAQQTANQTVEEAKEKAQAEAQKIVEQARQSIETEKNSAIEDMKKQIAVMSVEIAETLLKKQLDDKATQEKLVADMVKDLQLN